MNHDDDRESLPDLSYGDPSPEIGAAIRQAVAADLEKNVPRSLETRLWHGVAAAAIVGGLTIASFGPHALSASISNRPALALGLFVTLTAVAVMASFFSPKLQNVGRDTRMLIVAGSIAAWSLYVVSTVSDPSLEGMLHHLSGGCALRTIGAGLVVGAAFMWVWRKSDPWTPRVSGTLIGVCAGIVASIHVGVVCAGGPAGHVLMGHWIAVPILALAGYAVSRRALQP